jgi:hypothetical protein
MAAASADRRAYANLGKAVEAGAGQDMTAACPPPSEPFTLDNIDAAMRYQPWNVDQMQAGEEVRDALTMAAKAILRRVPDGPFRSVALREIINARMNANAAISFRGRF